MTSESNAGQDGGRKRPWYHLHLVTCVVLLVVAHSIGMINSTGPWDITPMPPDTFALWPFECFRTSSALPRVANLAFSCAFVLGVGLFIERWSRCTRRYFHLTSLFELVTVVAMTLALWRFEQPDNIVSLAKLFQATGFSLSLAAWDWTVSLPIFCALACTIYVNGWLATRLAGWCFRLVARRFRRSSAGGSA